MKPELSPDASDELENKNIIETIENQIEFNVDNSGYQPEENQIKIKRKYKRKNPELKITRKRSAEHNKKISESMQGRALSPEHKQAISESMIGNTNRK